MDAALLRMFEPEHVGKLNFYVQLIDDNPRDRPHDQATSSLLLRGLQHCG